MAQPRPIKVLYLHGFQETKKSPKPQALKSAKGLHVHVPTLDVNIMKQNGPGRHILPVLASVISGCVFVFGMSPPAQKFMYTATASMLSVCGLVCFHKQLLAYAVKKSFDKTLAIAEDAYKSDDWDVVVGFSWGGSLACEMVKQGIIQNRGVVLLGPARRSMAEAMRLDHVMTSNVVPQSSSSPGPRIHLVRGETDTICTRTDIDSLAASNSAHVVVNKAAVVNDGHMLLEWTNQGHLVQLVKSAGGG